MSLLINRFQLTGSILRSNLTAKVIPTRFICSTFPRFNENIVPADKQVDPLKDRSVIIPVETSIKYLQSVAYKQTYGNFPVWKFYRRNFKGQFPPEKTRKTCIRNNIVDTGSPCPICRDEYLIVDYRNIDLLKQFISEHNGETLSYKKTGLCQKAHNNLLVAIFKAKEYGLLTFDVPFRQYDYSEWGKS
ncbi:mitochondrial ribosomal protein S18B [Andrena cerasifolii]|uniref:mitochondrial ribosomal protein S18B n=1 Tax=Andrena cerasifolii TaxID=2819439 RepID=UPI004037C417